MSNQIVFKDPYADEEPVIDLFYRFDWSKTSLGDMCTWPVQLKNVVVCNVHLKTDQLYET